MSTGTIEGDLHGFTVSESSPIFIGRVLERGYYGEGRKPTGQGIVTTKVEVARVKVLEAFSLTPSQEVWATAAQEDPDEPISGSSSELTVGETYFFRSAGEWDLLVDQKGPVRALITYHYLSQLVELGQLRRLVKSETKDPNGGVMTITAIDTESKFHATITTSPRLGYRFENLPPGSYTFRAEKEGIPLRVNAGKKGTYSIIPTVEVRAGGCSNVDLGNGMFPVTFRER